MKIIKIKLLPKAEQERKLRRFLKNGYYIWKKLITSEVYNLEEAKKTVIELRKSCSFLKKIPLDSLIQVAENLNQIYENHKKGIAKKPTLKDYNRVIVFRRSLGLSRTKVKIPKCGWVKFKKGIPKEDFRHFRAYLKEIRLKGENQNFFVYLCFDEFIRFVEPYRMSEVNIQAEFYHKCRRRGIRVYLEYKVEHSRFDAVILDKNDNILFIIEFKIWKRKKDPNRITKQHKKYLKYRIPVLYVGKLEDINKTIEFIKGKIKEEDKKVPPPIYLQVP